MCAAAQLSMVLRAQGQERTPACGWLAAAGAAWSSAFMSSAPHACSAHAHVKLGCFVTGEVPLFYADQAGQ